LDTLLASSFSVAILKINYQRKARLVTQLAPRLQQEYSSTFNPPLGLYGLFWGELYFTLT
jgi:hypothetical protein